MKKLFIAVLVSTLTLSGCARNMNSSTYVSGGGSGKVLEGVVVSARPVTVKEADKLQDNGVGILGGGAAGAVAGSGIGKGRGQVGAEVGGAVAGAVIGALIQEALSTSDGMGYIVKVTTPEAKPQGNEKVFNSTKKSVKQRENVHDEIKDSIKTSAQTNLISVVQGKDVIFKEGQHVYVIYNDDRARLTAAN